MAPSLGGGTTPVNGADRRCRYATATKPTQLPGSAPRRHGAGTWHGCWIVGVTDSRPRISRDGVREREATVASSRHLPSALRSGCFEPATAPRHPPGRRVACVRPGCARSPIQSSLVQRARRRGARSNGLSRSRHASTPPTHPPGHSLSPCRLGPASGKHLACPSRSRSMPPMARRAQVASALPMA